MKFLLLAFIAIFALQFASAHVEFASREEYVDYLNNLPGMTWTAGVSPRFANLPMGASKSLLGVKPNNKAILEEHIKAGRVIRAPTALESGDDGADIPTAFDSATAFPACKTTIQDIRDQSACGCCWAFGAAEAASDRLCIATNGTIVVPLSAQALCFCASFDGCSGGDTTTPWQYIHDTGLVSGGQFNQTGPFKHFCSAFSLPHCHHHGPQGEDPYPNEGTAGCPDATSPACPSTCDAAALSPHNNFNTDKYSFHGQVTNFPDEISIQRTLMASGPVETAFNVYSDFENYVSGVYQPTSSTQVGGHAIKITGWGVDNGVKYWRISNSWNKYWGEQGSFRIIRGIDSCGIEDSATASPTGAVWYHM